VSNGALEALGEEVRVRVRVSNAATIIIIPTLILTLT
jgi:hypothetical protein